jgi:predicted RNase H-like nuclease (RuvC/YqgF family)
MKSSINFLHLQATDWLRQLDFYKQDLTFLRKRLEEVASKNTGSEIGVSIEHFENKFRILSDNLDQSKHDINERKANVDKMGMEMPTHISEKFVVENDKTENDLTSLISDFTATRKEFNEFLAKWM